MNYKHQRVYDAITRIGGIDGSLVGEIIPSDRITAYRNKAQLPIAYDKNGNITVGFFAQRSHRVISVDNCLLHSEAFNPIIDCFTDLQMNISLLHMMRNRIAGFCVICICVMQWKQMKLWCV